jgi:hypothetical protein
MILWADVAREVIRRVAPDELVFFSASAKAYFTGRGKAGGLDGDPSSGSPARGHSS